VADDAGGVWITTGWVLGILVYAGVVLAWRAGFGAALPFVVIPAVLVVMIGAGNVVGGRRPGRSGPGFRRPDLDPVPVSVLHGDRPTPPGDDRADGAPVGGPGTPG
jgi:hypothetical protein